MSRCLALCEGRDSDLAHVDLSGALGELPLRLGELLRPERELCAALFELALAVRPRGRLSRGELLLAPRQVGAHPLELIGLSRARAAAPVPHRREPAALGPKSPEPPSDAPLPERELPLDPFQLPLPDRDRRSPFP